MTLELRKRYKTFNGFTEFYSHESEATASRMNFAVFRPPVEAKVAVPVIYWLSGLTCSEENFMQKAGAQRYLAEKGIMLVAMDTSPRACNLPEATGTWHFGEGAGFYVNATAEPWSHNFRMDDYVSLELPALLGATFKVDHERQSIMGHSMGGHGALVLALRRPDLYRCVSAFAPIAAPASSAWGRYAFSRYLGNDEAAWAAYDASQLIRRANTHLPLRIDQGSCDEFLGEGQLRPELIAEAAAAASYPIDLRYQDGYDHSYYFVASFISEHIDFHHEHLKLS